MNFAFSEEQDAFRDALRRFLEERSPTAEVFRLLATPEGFDPAVWKQMAGELGLLGIHLPEAHGGQGFGLLELSIALEEMGRALLCAPYFSTLCLGASAILNAGTPEQQAALLPGIAAGETIATLALLEDRGWDADGVELEARRDGAGYLLSGRKRFVTDGAQATLVVVAAREPGSRGEEGISLLWVRGDAAGLSAEPFTPLDPTRKLAHLRFEGVRAEALGEAGGAAAALARTLDQARVALAAESAGGAQHCLDSAAGYARQRVQFGRPIGSFQAVKHRCADLLLEVESAKAAAHWAAWAASQDEDLALAASVAKSFCDEAYLRAAGDNIHIHGGIGFSYEADPHLYYRRAKATASLLGAPAYQHARIARILGF